MKNNSVLTYLIVFVVNCVVSNNSFSQIVQKIGTNANSINTNSVLELEATNKGFLLPRISLVSTTSFSPLTAHVAGMSVYNTATVGDVTPGYYYNDGTKWVRIGTTADGSETKVTAGTNVTVTGTGTTASPYIVNAAGATDATTTSKGIVQLAGDLSGTAIAPSVVKLQGQVVSSVVPTANQSLVWSGTAWTPSTIATNNIYTINGTISSNRIVTQGSNSLSFTSSATNGFSVDGSTFSVDAANDRIGIGTTSPFSKLVVESPNAGLSSTAITLVNRSSSPGTSVGLNFGASAAPDIRYASIAGEQKGSNRIDLVFSPGAGVSIVEQMRLDSFGNLGLGNNSPTEKLDVVGNVKFSGALMPNNLPGTAGQVLTSAGVGVAPTWTNALSLEVDGIIGNEVTDATVSGGLVRMGSGSAVSPYTLGVATGGIINTMLATDAVTSTNILDGTIVTADVANSAITGAKIENNVALPGTASMTLPSGTTAQRPVTATVGMSRYNTTDNIMEYYNGTSWVRPTAGTTYTGSASTVLNGTSFERAALIGDVTAIQNSNALTISNNAITSAKIADGTIATADLANGSITATKLNQMAATSGQSLVWNGTAWAPSTLTFTETDGIIGNEVVGATINGGLLIGGSGTTLAPYTLGIMYGGVSNTMLADGSVSAAKINQMSATSGQSLVWNGTIWAPSTVTLTETDGVIGNEVTDATLSGGLVRTGSGTSVSPYTLGIMTGGISTIMLANGSITATKLNQMSATNGQSLVWNGTTWAPSNVTFTETDGVIGNEVTDATLSGGLVRTGSGTTVSPYTLGITTGGISTSMLADGSVTAAKINQMSATNGQTLVWNGTVWAPTTQTSFNIYNIDGSLTGNRIVTQGANTLSFTSSATSGTSHFTVDGSTLSIDAVNNRVGIGNSLPNVTFHVSDITDQSSSPSAGAILGTIGLGGVNRTTPAAFIRASAVDWNDRAILEFGTSNGAGGNALTKMVLNEDGKLGIGTSNPTSTLHVMGDVLINNLAGTGDRIVIANSSGVLSTQAITNIYSSNGTLISDRTVTMGTNRLNFNTTLNAPQILVKNTNSTGSYVSFSLVRASGVSGQEANWLLTSGINGSTKNIGIEDVTGARTGIFNAPFQIESGTSGNILLNRGLGGNIGIGTGSPSQKLHVQGGVLISSLAGTGNRMVVANSSGVLGTQSISNIYETDGILVGNRIVTQGANTLAFTSTVTNGFSVDGSTLSIDGANNMVGFGTSTPTSTIHSSGTFALNTATSGTANSVVLLSTGTFTPPTASTVSGRIYIIRNTSAATNVSVASVIDYGATSSVSFTLTPAIGSVMIISDGTSWFRIQ